MTSWSPVSHPCFGIHGSVLSWFKSYLSSRCFRVKCETDLSWYTSSCGVPQGSVLGPILFVMYTTPFSTLISSCSLNHHFYADDTQLFLSFLPTHLDSSIDPLHDALDRISSWMTANLLTLYSSKTEFLIIGPSKQLAKINNSSFTVLDQCQPRLLAIICPSPLTYAKQRPITASQSSRYDMLAIFSIFCCRSYVKLLDYWRAEKIFSTSGGPPEAWGPWHLPHLPHG